MVDSRSSTEAPVASATGSKAAVTTSVMLHEVDGAKTYEH